MKKTLALLLSLLLVVGVFAACGGNNDPAPAADPAPQEEPASTEEPATEEPAAAEEATIKVANWDTDTATAYVKVLVTEFEKQNPNVKVEIMDIPSADYTQKLSVMLNGGSDVDAFFIKDGDTTQDLADKGQLADLSEYIARDGIDLAGFNGLAELFDMNDKMVALPTTTGYYVLFYNTDIFDEAGVDYPSNDMTWEEFEALAKELTSGEGADKKYGAFIHTWNACVQNWGVQDGKNTIMDYETGYDFFKPYYDMTVRMQDEGTIMDYSTIKSGEIHYSSPFYQGDVAMLPMGTWFMSMLIEKINAGETDVNWAVATLPHPSDTPAGYTVGGGPTPIAINEASENKDAAWEFIKFVTSDEGAKIYAEAGAIPARGNDATLAGVASVEGMPEGIAEALQVTNISLDRPMVSKVGEVNKMLDEQHSLIMIGEETVDDGLAEMAKQSEEIQNS